MLPCWWVTVAIVSVSLFLKRAIGLRHFLCCFTGRRGDLGYRWVSLQCYSRHKELSATESYFWWICAGKLSTYIIILVTRREAAHALKSKVVTVWINKRELPTVFPQPHPPRACSQAKKNKNIRRRSSLDTARFQLNSFQCEVSVNLLQILQELEQGLSRHYLH